MPSKCGNSADFSEYAGLTTDPIRCLVMYRQHTLPNIKSPEATALIVQAYNKKTSNMYRKDNRCLP